ncbi:mitochondrial pyruvate carrier 1-like [Triticum dicoccoides]|uniref:mitochondrial pyruvate carrier 1-like n=1 Tax=Triticum dicoccoides TaxID=85692 RepID=UPI00188E0819|nr:mitochondrial pyruvate carrier 1-like [Triticum dicoccoides]
MAASIISRSCDGPAHSPLNHLLISLPPPTPHKLGGSPARSSAVGRLHEGLHPHPRTARFSAMATAFKAFLNSPVGPKTTHFWGPVSNWGFILAGMADMNKPPELISGHMTAVMCVYSGLFMRFAWVVRPRNYFLMATHASNESVQLYQLSRCARAQGYLEKKEPEAQQ